MNTASPDLLPWCTLRDVSFGFAGQALLQGVSFDIHPGLTLLQGGDGRGKSTLLRIVAGQLQPQAGTVLRRAQTVFFDGQVPAAADDAVLARAWLQSHRQHHVAWDEGLAAELASAFRLQDHLPKPLYMLSTGSRRKLGLVAAAASGAQLTLVDNAFAGLDAPSCRCFTEVLRQAAAGRQRSWVLADHALPVGLLRRQLVGVVDLGD